MEEVPSFGVIIPNPLASSNHDTIPVSAFYKTPVDNKVLRFCFAKKEETLEAAVERLVKFF